MVIISCLFFTENDNSRFPNSGDNTVPLQTKISSDYLKEVFNNDDEPRLAQKQMGNQKHLGDTSRNERKPELITKHFKDILIRSYSSFVQIIMSPVTTGLKHTINVNVCEELIDVMKQLLNIDDCKAILLTGIGTTFCQGIFVFFTGLQNLKLFSFVIKHNGYRVTYLYFCRY